MIQKHDRQVYRHVGLVTVVGRASAVCRNRDLDNRMIVPPTEFPESTRMRMYQDRVPQAHVVPLSSPFMDISYRKVVV